MKQGFLSIILHAHLPYVRHPEYTSFFEENWLFEAITECYMPLLGVLERLQQDNINYRLTLSLSPTLISMLRDELLITRYVKHLHKLIELSDKECDRTRDFPKLHQLAQFYQQFFQSTLDRYQNHYQCDILSAFKQHHSTGKLDLITTAATHGFLPALSVNRTAVCNQIKLGIDTFKAHLNIAPSGFWLPECAYYPGLEEALKEAGIQYFFVDSHAILNAHPPAQHGVYAPLHCSNHVAAFGRDPESSKQVWSSHEGYPGDEDYREYYRDIGFDLDLDYLAPYILDKTTRINTGIKYYRITGNHLAKALYNPKAAALKAQQHAEDFINRRQQQIATLSTTMTTPPIIVAPYDAELFGHWWFEGPIWLEQVLRLASDRHRGVQTVSCQEYLNLHAPHQIATPSTSTWGDQGYSSFWINEENDWIYPYLHQAEDDMEKLASDLADLAVTPLQKRALNQAARSLLLAQASDWPFMLKAGTTRDYARKRVLDHLARFNYLHDSIRKNSIDERYLLALETMDNIFPDINFRDFNPNQSTHLTQNV